MNLSLSLSSILFFSTLFMFCHYLNTSTTLIQGKTSTALALAQALYGPTLYKTRILEMNASDERGIKVMKEIPRNKP